VSISRIHISNFKSFGQGVEVDLHRLNVLIGVNASGKSNFVEAFDFLRDLAKDGLESAISYSSGGIDYLKNLRSQPKDPIELEVTAELKYKGKSGRTVGAFNGSRGAIEIDVSETRYKFVLWPTSDKAVEETITHRAKVTFIPAKGDGSSAEPVAVLDGEIQISSSNGILRYSPLFIRVSAEAEIATPDVFNPFFMGGEIEPKDLLIQNRLNFFGQHFLDDIGIYDFDPNLPRDARWGPGSAELERDGENLAIVMKAILDDPEKKRKLLNLMGYILPSVSEMRTEQHSDGSVLPAFSETYNPEAPLPATIMSDGTISVTDLIVALYFTENSLVVIEEPDRSIHPSLISAVMSLIREVSEKKQVIITTHNPELLRHVEAIGDILLVSRDHQGDSQISRPAQKDEIKAFLSEELGIAELFVSNLLGA
jgi:predicted ATPase